MMRSSWGTSASEFRWAVGIESTFVPQTRRGHRGLDEYELMDHYRLWRGDLDLAADLGISTIRYGVPWYRVNPRPGAFDWAWTDEVFEHMAGRRGLTPIVDLMHYGTPSWLAGHFADPSYPERVAEYAARFAERYGSLVHWYTPLNEPAVTAAYCGRDGRWPPYLRGPEGYVTVLLSLVEGVVRTARALRAADPSAVLVHVEDIGVVRPGSPSMAAAAEEAQLDRLLPMDLACGKVDPSHPRHAWLLGHGASAARLEAIAAGAPDWDILGVNSYPWSNRTIVARRGGGARSVGDPSPGGLGDALRLVHGRYGRPLFVTETSSAGTPSERYRWMRGTLSAVTACRAEGVPVVGYTWFPLFTMIEWTYRWSRRRLDDHLLHLGLYDVRPEGGRMDREPTPLVEAYRRHVADPAGSIGEWAPPGAAAPAVLVA